MQLVLEKVLLLGSKTQTIIGRPFVPKAFVHAAVEEQVMHEVFPLPENRTDELDNS